MVKEKGYINQISVADIADGEAKLVRIAKSNYFITAFFQSNLFINKIFAISLSRLSSSGDHLKAEILPSEIRKLIKDDVNVYRTLKKISDTLITQAITIEDGKGNFKKFTLAPNVDYCNHVLTIHFNRELTEHIAHLKGSYTTYALATLLSFETNTAFRLYEILKKDVYKLSSKTPCVIVKYDFNELKCMLSLVNTDRPYVQDAIKKGKSWEEIVEKIATKKDKRYDRFVDFRKYVLEPAMREIEQKTDIAFEYNLEKMPHGKVKYIVFIIRKNNPALINEAEYSERIQTIEVLQKEDATERGFIEFLDYIEENNLGDKKDITADIFNKLLIYTNGDIDALKQRAFDILGAGQNIRNAGTYLLEMMRYAELGDKIIEDVDAQPDTYAEQDNKKQTAIMIWDEYREREDITSFVKAFRYESLEEMENIFTPVQLVNMYIKYRSGPQMANA